MRSLSLTLALCLVGPGLRAADSPPILQGTGPQARNSDRAESAQTRPESGNAWWYLVFLAATLGGGLAVGRDWVRRRRQARAIRDAVAVPVRAPGSRLGEDGHWPPAGSTHPNRH